MRLQEFTLVFSVSLDEEYVRLHLVSSHLTLDLGARNHNYLLLTLARRLLRDVKDGMSDVTCGWVLLNDWSHDPSTCSLRLNIHVHRIRRQFASRRIVDAETIIERRVQNRQMRLGTTRVRIDVL
jgi:hypothetical protein